uniref:Uncharacterized protein n=1 Tax=viral metagenome TaxID=1070528 RepID=A0A6M3LSC8_9ZZZZ
MKIIRASRKVEKAIDALIDLQQDYMDEITAAEVVYDVGTVLDTLNRISTALETLV